MLQIDENRQSFLTVSMTELTPGSVATVPMLVELLTQSSFVLPLGLVP